MYDNDFKTKENKILTKEKIELQHIHVKRLLSRYTFLCPAVLKGFFSNFSVLVHCKQ